MQFARRRFEESDMFGPEPLEFSVASPEDVILSKLNWYVSHAQERYPLGGPQR
jgi:hypothetical protein